MNAYAAEDEDEHNYENFEVPNDNIKSEQVQNNKVQFENQLQIDESSQIMNKDTMTQNG